MVRLRYQRLLALPRPFYRLLRHRSVWVVGTLLHSALGSGHLCQVRAARHRSLLDSVVVQFTDSPPCLGIKKQGVVKVVIDAWLAPAGLRGGQILEASTRTSPPATLSSPLPPLFPRVENSVMDWAALS